MKYSIQEIDQMREDVGDLLASERMFFGNSDVEERLRTLMIGEVSVEELHAQAERARWAAKYNLDWRAAHDRNLQIDCPHEKFHFSSHYCATTCLKCGMPDRRGHYTVGSDGRRAYQGRREDDKAPNHLATPLPKPRRWWQRS